MPISKIKSSSITADAASTNLNIDANTLFLDATNNRVGVGTSSPLQKLDVVSGDTAVRASIRSTSSGATNVALVLQDGTTGTGADGIYLGRTGEINYLWTYENEPWVFASNNTERMRITATGNVGIGTSSPAATLDIVGPSAGASPYLSKSIQFAPSNFPDRTWSLNYDDSGSAGNGFNISSQSTKILYLNSTGKVGIGTVSPVAQLDIENSSVQPFGTAAQLNAVFKGSVSIGQGGAIGFDYFGSHTNAPTSMGYAIESQAGSTKGSLVFGTRSVTTDTAPTERMRITSAGNVGIGTTNPTTKLHIVQSSAATAIKVITDDYPTGTNGGTMSGSLEFVGSGWNASLGAQDVGVMVEPIAAYWGADNNMSGYGQTYPYLNFKTKNSDSEYITRARVDGFGRFWMNSGYGSIAIAYGCRAWARITGAGGSGGSPGTGIDAGGNVSSLTRNSTGNYTLNFTNSMPDANYAFSGNQETGNITFDCIMTSYNQYTTGVNFITLNNGTPDNFRYGSVAIFR